MAEETGKYVRVPSAGTHGVTEQAKDWISDAETDSEDEMDLEDEKDSQDGRDSGDGGDPEDEEGSQGEVNCEDGVNPEDRVPTPEALTTAESSPVVTMEMFAVLQKAIVDLAQVILEKPWEKTGSASNTTNNPTTSASDSWGRLGGPASTSEGQSAIRMEGIPSFPKDVAASGMWEAFNQFIEKFEIAISLNNITEPIRQAKLLYLALGDNLQTIVRAAGLRPDLNEPDCYRKMVTNITEYFLSMTDTAAEHESFSQMRQEQGESTMAFYARLTGKVQLCRYSESDQARFVRAQLLKGMSNRELAKAVRTFGHDAAFVVQSATRHEAFEMEANRPCNPEGSVQAVSRAQTIPQKHRLSRPPIQRPNKSSNYNNIYRQPRESSRSHTQPRGKLGKRGRCSRCDRPAHGGGECPAKNQDCHRCGVRGHFAVTCRAKEANVAEKQ